MKTLHFDKELLEITVTEEIDNNVFHYNIGKHVSSINEYKKHKFVRDNTCISDVLDNENVKTEDVIVVFLNNNWVLDTNNTQNTYTI